MQRLLRELLGKVNDARGIGALILGLLSGSFSVFGFFPFTCAVFTAFVMADGAEYMAACGAALGIMLRSEYTAFLPLGICILLCSLWKLWQAEKLKLIDRILILSVSELSVIFIRHATLKDCLLVPVMCIVSIISALVVYNGINSLRCCIKRKRLASESDLLSLSLFTCFSVFIMSPVHTEHIAVATVAAGCIAMICSCASDTYGLCVAVLTALGAGFNYGTSTFSVSAVGIISLTCVMCSIVKNYGKAAIAAMYLFISILLGFFVSKCMTLADCCLPAALFVCIPSKFIYMANAYISSGRDNKTDAAIKRRVKVLAKAALGINDALNMGSLSNDGQLAIRQLGAITGLLDSLDCDKKQNYPIKVDIGMACIPKSKCAHTGDSVGTAEANGRTVIAVSDGMGSGILAHNESSAAIESFIDMTKAGFNTCDSIDCVNRRLIARCENEFYATLDALVIDRLSCIATVVKMGAPPSFLVREGAVHDICGESLPLGIVETVIPSVKKIPIQPGDIFVILTDGVTDAMGKNLVASITDYATLDKTPGEIANSLLDIASYDGAQDDMSIVCVKVRSKKSKT